MVVAPPPVGGVLPDATVSTGGSPWRPSFSKISIALGFEINPKGPASSRMIIQKENSLRLEGGS